VVEGNIYRHFENKRALLVKAVEDWYEEMLSNYDEHLQGISGTRNRLRYMIWRHLSTIETEPALCCLVFGELRSGSDYRSTSVFELNRQYTRRTMDIIEEGIAAGEFRPDVSVTLVRDLIYGCVEHHTWGYLRGEGTFSADASADAITDIVFAGLKACDQAVETGEKKEGGTADARDAVSTLLAAARRMEAAAARLEANLAREHVSKSTRRKSR